MALIATGATSAASPAAASMAASELMAQGRNSAAVLETILQGASLPPAHGGLQLLAAEILRCCDRALTVMRAGEAAESSAAAAAAGVKRKPATTTAPANRKRRANGGSSGGGASSPAAATRVERSRTSEDGYLWRKYGQKEIKNSKRPRLYFRCSYKDDDGCTATRHVQQSEDDPSLYVITYFGDHTCSRKLAAGVDEDDGTFQKFVINFGSASASSSPPLLYESSSYSSGIRRETTSTIVEAVKLLLAGGSRRGGIRGEGRAGRIASGVGGGEFAGGRLFLCVSGTGAFARLLELG
uniref:WRKY domain-containing protein n=1 Tax=Leersia perrieri TaxID=77586 RepID=A0A0D9WHQ6_9ORYZ